MFDNKSILIALSLVFIGVYGTNTVCDSKLECKGDTIDTDSVECSALRACAQAVISSTNVTCEAEKACQYTDLTNVIVGQCSAYKACRRSDITVNGELSCSAENSCACSTVTVSEDSSLICTGENSCSFYENNGYANCDGKYEGPLDLSGSVECSGDYACEANTIYARATSDSILCDGPYSCYYTDIELDDDLNNEFTIDAEAEYSLYNSEIFSGENNELSISLDGYNSGYNLEVYCESGSTCSIDCEGEACDPSTTILYCANTTDVETTCDTDCNCDEDACATIVIYDDVQQGMTMKEKLSSIKKERINFKKSSNYQISRENVKSNFKLNKYKKHLKFNGNAVSYTTLNYYYNTDGWLWTRNHYTMLFGVIIGIISSVLLYSLYYCYQKGKKINNFQEYQPLTQN